MVINLKPTIDFSGSYSVVKGKKTLEESSYGFSNREEETLNNTNTIFKIASLTKIFTAICVLKLARKGLISLKADIQDYISIPRKGINVIHLLSHSSGIPEFTLRPDFQRSLSRFSDQNDLCKFIKKLPNTFMPGYMCRYSNSNYILLGEIIEQVTDASFASIVSSKILSPLKMKNTGLLSDKCEPREMAIGYRFTEGEMKRAKLINMSVFQSAGGMYSCVKDLLKFGKALHSGKLLNLTWKRYLFEPSQRPYSCGCIATTINNMKYLFACGRINGFSSYLGLVPDKSITVVILSNCQSTKVRDLGEDFIRTVIDSCNSDLL